jgi:hypothetical protein
LSSSEGEKYACPKKFNACCLLLVTCSCLLIPVYYKL